METSPPSPSANNSAQPDYAGKPSHARQTEKPSYARQSKSPPMRGKRKSPPLRGKALPCEAILEDKGKAANKQVYDTTVADLCRRLMTEETKLQHSDPESIDVGTRDSPHVGDYRACSVGILVLGHISPEMIAQSHAIATLSSTSLQKIQTHQTLMKSHQSSSLNQKMIVISGKSSRTQTVKTKL